MKNINASKLGKLSHKKKPRSKEFYQKMQKASVKKRMSIPRVKKKKIGDSRNLFRDTIRLRDNHTCQKCGKKWLLGQRKFDVHHLEESMDGKSRMKGIQKYDRKNTDKLITLCHKCHFSLDVTRKKIRKS